MAPPFGPLVPTVLREAPSVSAYTPLPEYESHTPASFAHGPPVLHYHTTGARVLVDRQQRARLPFWGEGAGGDVGGDGDIVAQTVDVFVGSDSLVLYSPAAGRGIALPYPAIGIHAIKSTVAPDGQQRGPAIYMQLEMSGAGESGGDELDTVEVTIVPGATTPTNAAAATTQPAASAPPPPSAPASEASQMFSAISACADLHPDRLGNGDDDDDDDDAYPSFFQNGNGNGYGDDDDDYEYDYQYEDSLGGDAAVEPVQGMRGVFRERRGPSGGAAAALDLPPPMPGSCGWITAENAHEYFDANGNWRGRGQLGEGAGRVRTRDEAEAAVDASSAEADAPAAATASAAASVSANVDAADNESENKRHRTE